MAAKFTATQANYAMNRVEQMRRDAQQKYRYKTDERDIADTDIAAALKAKGFTVLDSYRISSHIKPPANSKAALEAKKVADKVAAIDAAAQAAKDRIMLGELGEVVGILADFDKVLQKLKG